jgi:hypothetical protein
VLTFSALSGFSLRTLRFKALVFEKLLTAENAEDYRAPEKITAKPSTSSG